MVTKLRKYIPSLPRVALSSLLWPRLMDVPKIFGESMRHKFYGVSAVSRESGKCQGIYLKAKLFEELSGIKVLVNSVKVISGNSCPPTL